MRIFYLILLSLSASIFVAPALAQEQRQDRVVIVTDQEAGAVRFVIDGKETARLDATGLHLREDISYGGVLTDYGTTGFERHIADGDAEASDAE